MLYELSTLVSVIHHAIHVLRMLIELIITQLKAHILQYQQAGGHTNGQAGDINGGKSFVFPEIAKAMVNGYQTCG
jgi:hypothetical protein